MAQNECIIIVLCYIYETSYKLSFYSPGWPCILHHPASASQLLTLQACTTVPVFLFLFLSFFLSLFWGRVSRCSPGYPGTFCVDETSLLYPAPSFFFKAGLFCVELDLELRDQPCLCLPSVEIKGVHLTCLAFIFLFLIYFVLLSCRAKDLSIYLLIIYTSCVNQWPFCNFYGFIEGCCCCSFS